MKKKLLFITIAETLMEAIISGELTSGSQVDSVRDMAVKYKVNPKTIQKAFEYLESKQIFFTKPGEGRFVTEDETKLQSIKAMLIDEQIDEFISVVSKYDLSTDELIEILKQKLN
ncbi:GntR family transcriptional regulator [Mollicutes bacterium LVI A0078]|nr:GntR family transcriptional regulator [Mollicutes bacterium LVI A0075]WOO91634.1 GntR family transcriptional regulator [Mollicutes bacterium LVI A0078]